jgi:hypothetical protein
MVEFLDDELLPHAAAEESVLYTAGDRDPTALLVRAMREEHVSLKTWVPHLRGAADGLTAASTALAIEALFETHLWKENELLLPALLTNPAVDLGEALLGMHDLLG